MDIPACLVDTNILLRITRPSDPQYAAAYDAVAQLAISGTRLCFCHQNIAELWNAMTRPTSRNGCGLTTEEAELEVRSIEAGMELLADSEAVYREWRRLVALHEVSGVQVHDARLAATVLVHEIRYILTFNVDDFKRYPHLVAVHPSGVLA